MTDRKQHADEFDIDETLVRRLLVAQFPELSALPLARVASHGTDNAMFRLGADMAARLPRRPSAAVQTEKEQVWLPRLAPHLPLAVPVPLACGKPAEGYPWRWSVCRWIEGETLTQQNIADPRQAAVDLAQFVGALRRIDAQAAPPPGAHNFGRGAPLALRDAATRDAIAALHDTVDEDAAVAAWEAGLNAQPWQGPPEWIHGDLSAGNLLVDHGRLAGVIDFGGLAAGDPACDLLVAWNLLSGEARDAYRTALKIDDAGWRRGRAWALSVALIQLPYYRDTSPAIATNARETIREVIADHRRMP